MAMGSNVAFALRSILRKDLPKDFKVFTSFYFVVHYCIDARLYVRVLC